MNGPKLWGGVFSKGPDELAWCFGQSVESDMTLFEEEFRVSKAHANMLAATGIVSTDEGASIVRELESVRLALLEDRATIAHDAEDLHGAIESLLVDQIGDVAKKLHSGRSRNDQIVTVTKLWTKRACSELDAVLMQTQLTLVSLATKHKGDPMPGYTHQQPAQPITLGFLFLAYFWMLDRDRKRFQQVMAMADECPLGSAALAGTTLPIDRGMTAFSLGFTGVSPNALDAVSDRDFVGDALHACATLMQHLSRISQEIVLASTDEFGTMQLDEAYSTGSSMMPQKRNPDFAELIRGRTGRAIGNWTGFMSMMKGLPLGYNRDQQEDKPPLFDSIKLCLDSLHLVDGMLGTAVFDTARLSAAAGNGFSTATGVCEALVMAGIPFRTAHEIVGSVVKTCQKKGIALNELTASDLPADSPPCLLEALANSSVADSINARESEGGPGPIAFAKQLELAKSRI